MPAPTEPSIKGTLLLARLRFLRTLGPGTLEGALARLAPPDADRLRSMILPSSWYPLALLRRLEAAIVACLDLGGPSALHREIGRAAAAQNLAGPQRSFVRAGDPHFLLQHAPAIYASYFSFGSRTYERTGPNSAVIRTVKSFEGARVEECQITAGWLQRGIEIAGAREVRVEEIQCGVAGAPCCEFRCEWLPAAAAAPSASIA